MLFSLDILCLWTTECQQRLTLPIRFSPGPLLFPQKYFINLFFALIRLFVKDNGFSKKHKIFPFNSFLVSFCLHVFLWCFLYSSIIMKLQSNNIFFWPLIKSCDIMKELTVWNLPAVVVSSALEQTKLEIDTTPIIFNYFYHWDLRKEVFRNCSSLVS